MSLRSRRIVQTAYIFALCFAMLLEYAAVGKATEELACASDGYIKLIDFDVTAAALADAVRYDVDSYGSDNHVSLVTLLALLGTRYGGDFKRYKKADMKELFEALTSGKEPAELVKNKKTYDYYVKAYGAVLDGAVGEYGVRSADAADGLLYEKRYGLKLFSPIAAGYYYSHFDDFGAARSYGYKRPHLGHDMMGSVGTPIVAVESGYVEACGWNQYGGWRVGIRSFDGKRYYYYAHLRRGHPYNDVYEGKIVEAGEVIGYLGMTGYSAKEDVNNIDTPHLHFGLQIIFDPSQKDGWNQIWLDMYEFTRFLERSRAEVYYDKELGESVSKSAIIDLSAPD